MHLTADIRYRQDDFTLNCGFCCQNSAMGIFGVSGSGKSTLFRALAGLIKPDLGRICLNGRTLFDSDSKIFIPPEERRIGLVFQGARLFPHWNVEQNLRAGEFKKSRIESRPFSFDDIVDLLEIKSLISRRVHKLSGGEKRRIAIGRALLSNPELLLLDEPLTGLDMKLKSQLLPFFSKIHTELNMPVILISHDLREILYLTDNLMLLDNGVSAGHDSLRNLTENPETLKAFNGSDLTNVFNAELLQHKAESGVSVLRFGDQKKIYIEDCQKLPIGTELKISIDANQIALSRTRVEHISMRNQVPVTVNKITHCNGRSICSLDCGGETLLAEITLEAQNEMQIHEGDQLLMLFKCLSIKKS